MIKETENYKYWTGFDTLRITLNHSGNLTEMKKVYEYPGVYEMVDKYGNINGLVINEFSTTNIDGIEKKYPEVNWTEIKALKETANEEVSEGH